MIDKMDLRITHELNKYTEKIGRLYLCKSCTRSFHSKEITENCKFCGSDVVELNGHKKQLYRFYCPVCYKSIVTSDSITSCPKCNNKFLHSYPVDKIWKREFLRMRKRQILGNIKKALITLKRK